MTLLQAQQEIEKMLREGGVENAEGEARFLLQDALGLDRAQLLMRYREPAREADIESAFAWAKRRADGEPLQYILGHTDFMGLDIRVAPGVLIPRPETEGLCELFLQEAKRRATQKSKQTCRILDLCTGSGCVAAWAGHAFAQASVSATDLSEDALAIARKNCAAHEAFPGQIEVLQGDLFEALPQGVQPFDVILSNPPYIPSATVDLLASEVKDHEPRLALDGGEAGMDVVSRIIAQAPGFLAPGGLLLMEIDETQEEAVKRACGASGAYADFAVLCDLAGKVRYLKARL